MCGILGYSGAYNSVKLSAGLAAIAHRGPDDSGEFVEHSDGVGLGHVRLSILDLSLFGHQPMTSSDGNVVLVFNGEIYNFRELRAELEAKDFVFRGHSDTEVLLNLYLAEGESMLSRLNGIFAFAIWDNRNKSLLVVRDGLGVKPLYYSATKCGVAFASEIKGLLPMVSEEARELDAVSLHRYLSFLWCPGEGTPLKAVHKLLPGEAMIICEGKIKRKWIWYELPLFRGIKSDLDEKSSIEGTITFLRQAVQRQMVADVPVGAFLSGGLDSSAVVVFAREVDPDLRCFTIEATGGQEAGATDDLPYARRVAKHLGVKLDVVNIDAQRIVGDLERMVSQLDEPLADPAALNVLYISQLAREQGMKVLLSGVGGDDLFTGYRRHRAVQAERLWHWLPQTIRQGLDRVAADLDQRRAWSRRLAKLFNGAGLESNERLANYFVWARENDLLCLYSDGFREQLGSSQAVAPLIDFLQPLPENTQPLQRMLALEQRFFLADHNLTYTDKMSMAAGVEVRVPFLDIDLVDFAQRIPLHLKQRGLVGKWVLKKAMEPYLPRDVIYRPKAGFGAPLRHWISHDLRELLGDLLSPASLNKRGLFNPLAVQRLIVANDVGKVDASYTLFSLLCIEIWCRRFIDGI